MADKAWLCSECGTVNEAGARACRECGRWPSLFDLQESAVEEAEPEVFEPEVFEPEVFEPGASEPDVFEPQTEEGEDKASVEQRGRFPRWVVSAIWVIAVVVWIIVNAFVDSN